MTKRIGTYDDLKQRRTAALPLLALRQPTAEDYRTATQSKRKNIMICGGTGCQASESAKLQDNLTAIIKEKGLEADVQAVVTGCFGFCEKGPIVKVYLR